MVKDMTIFIPALKKRVVFQDDLVKKLAGVTLIQRAINKALEFGGCHNRIHVLTDSDEIRLIAERNGVACYYDPPLIFDDTAASSDVIRYMIDASRSGSFILVLSPYAPLLSSDMVVQAVETLAMASEDILKPLARVPVRSGVHNGTCGLSAIFSTERFETEMLAAAFVVFKCSFLEHGMRKRPAILHWLMPTPSHEINSFHDWWVCEKLIQRKRIVFRVIGNKEVGMGHIYRALSIAHEIVNHEVLFVTDAKNAVAVNQLAGYDYWLETYKPEEVVDRIIGLKPDLVVNDMLATSVDDVLPLQKEGIRVVNFEDLGYGAAFADLTINELYDVPQIPGDRILWGHKYFFVRDEFHDAHAHRFKARVSDLLITFGGTDQHNLSKCVLLSVYRLCKDRGVHIHIAVGAGYAGYDDLETLIQSLDGFVTLTRATGVISRIMEKCQVAITSNGRTVYELAHMNIPAIVISQHDREKTHEFACEDNGFISIGLYRERETEKRVVDALIRLLDDEAYRHTLFSKTTRFQFSKNKQHVIQLINSLL